MAPKASTSSGTISISVMESTRSGGNGGGGDALWGVGGHQVLFEDRRVLLPQFLILQVELTSCPRYDIIDYIYVEHLSPARLMETHNRRQLEAFVGQRPYVRERGDPEA
jgi:hypothetical protein